MRNTSTNVRLPDPTPIENAARALASAQRDAQKAAKEFQVAQNRLDSTTEALREAEKAMKRLAGAL